MKKQFFCAVLAVLLSLSILPMQAQAAATTGQCGENVTWSFDSSTGELLISGSGKMDDYASANSVPWKAYWTQIKSATITEGITNIGSNAFYLCQKLTTVEIPSSVTAIGRGAFLLCEKMPAVTLPENLLSIGNEAFVNCKALRTITIPASVRTIGTQAFANCTRLTKITVDDANTVYSSDSSGVLFNREKTVLLQAPGGLRGSYSVPNSVQTISSSAFYQLAAITAVTIPASVHQIEKNALVGCERLQSITVDDANPYYSSDESGVLFNKNQTVLLQAPGGLAGDYRIPGTVTELNAFAFADCFNLNTVRFLGKAPQINATAFSGVVATAFYPAGDDTWTETVKLNYGGTLTWSGYVAVSGTITSTSTDPITVELLQGGNVVATTTAANGAYTFADVTDGDYTLRVSQTGMATAEVNVTVAGASVSKDVALYAESELITKITHTLDLGGMISMSYHVTPGSGVSGVTAVGYLRDGVPGALESIPATDGRYHFTYPVAAKQMTDEIYFEVTAEKDGVRYTLTPDVFTVEQYCTAVINQANAPANLKEVARNMLTYGAYAQKYFGYNVDNLANKNNGVALDPNAVVKAVKKTGTDFNGTVKGQLTSNTLLLESEVGIRYFLTLNAGVNADNMYLAYYREGTAEVSYVKVTYENGRYHAVVPNIAAKNLSSYYVAYLCEKNGETYTQVSQTSAFSAACYAYAVYSNANAPAELKDCVVAMMMYGNAAKTLFGV